MWRDPIVAEVRRAREQYSARFGHDIKAICRAAREEQAKSGRPVVSLKPKPLAEAIGTEGDPRA